MEFHISRRARDRYGVSEVLFNYAGNVIFANIAASRELTDRVNRVRDTHHHPERAIHAGSLFAMGLIDELSHALIAQYRKSLDPQVLPAALQWIASQANEERTAKLLQRFTDQFPNAAIYTGKQTVEEWLGAATEGMPHREAALEELLLLWLANVNRAFVPFREFFDDQPLAQQTIYKQVTTRLDDYFSTRPKFAPEVGTLLDALRAPMLASPDSLTGQLAYIRDHWAPYLGDSLKLVLRAIDILKEEEIAVWMQFHPPEHSARHPFGEKGWRDEGFEGDEYIGFGGRRFKRGSIEQRALIEYEAFSPDQAWMPTVVLIAKSTYVWLEQLSKKYQRHIYRLDQIPHEELQLLADRGLNGLWLIGLWERSKASQTIKRLRGQWDAVASAYSLADYRIADDLGGEEAYRYLRDQAASVGIRLASDMVPNHMGIDSDWVIEHPERFLQRPESPYPAYRFEGPDLSTDSRVEIKIEDHYYDQTDAAVVFRWRERSSGHTRYIYHGNDGTTFAWNDTAQLDYSQAAVREQVMQTILQVARLFPIIRFDAAMTLAKKHVQRLWFPLPGVGGSIPSRSEYSMTNEEFDALMPHEFWREVVDRVAVEVPGTLLLAEAFWLLEGYFVRTLGMHRVYNSAFMNMLRDEENAKYRSYLKKTIEFDPDILKRYVNFMSNPDERTAIDQFGAQDRYFGVATLLATLPGLPMFGHGQIEGFTEKYGMEYKQARMEEWPNEELVARHQREIAPLLKNRQLFAGSSDFFLYDFWDESGKVDENVYAYSNLSYTGGGLERAIIFFHNRYAETRGTIHGSAESMDKGSGELRTRRLHEALRLPGEDGLVLAYQDRSSGLHYLRRAKDLAENGLRVELRAYQYLVLLDWRELRSSAREPWDQLCDSPAGQGVPDLGEALERVRLQPVHAALRELLREESVREFIERAAALRAEEHQRKQDLETAEKRQEGQRRATAKGNGRTAPKLPEAIAPREELSNPASDSLRHVLERTEQFFASAHEFTPEAAPYPSADQLRAEIEDALRLPGVVEIEMKRQATASYALWAPVFAWSVLRSMSVDVFDRLQLRRGLAEAFVAHGMEWEESWRASARVRLLLSLRGEEATGPLECLIASLRLWSDPDVRWLASVQEHEGKTYLHKESFESLLRWLTLPEHETAKPQLDRLAALAAKAGYEVPKLIALLAPPTQTEDSKPLEESPGKQTLVES
ncbi:MAG TPA: alpha-amylase family glycosyl hydrolase [Granulicella sp.]